MKNKKNVLVVLLLVVGVAVLGKLAYNTYARYASEASGKAEVTAALWQVKVETEDISNGTPKTLTNNLSVTLEDSDVVVADKIAPNRSGTFEVEIDPTGSEVAVDYSVAIGTLTAGTPSNLTITGYKVKTGTGEYGTLETGTTAAGTIQLPGTTNNRTAMTAAQKTKVQVIFEWANVEEDNAEDTTYGSGADRTIEVPVTLTVRQHIA